jgi:hypothetical protein
MNYQKLIHQSAYRFLPWKGEFDFTDDKFQKFFFHRNLITVNFDSLPLNFQRTVFVSGMDICQRFGRFH